MTDSIEDQLKERAKTCKHQNLFFVGTTGNMQAWCKWCGQNVTHNNNENFREPTRKSSTKD